MQTSDEADLIQIEQNLREALLKFNHSQNKLYQLSFSIGRSMYDVSHTTDSFLNEMDNHMYEEKRTKHSRSSVKTADLPA